MTIRTTTRRPNRTLTLPALALAGALTLSACGGGDGAADAPTDEPTSQGTTDSATDDGTADDGATDDDTADDDATDDDATDDADDADDTTDDADGAGATGSAITVQVEGQGVKLLRVVDDGDDDGDDATSSDDDQTLEGKLISGPGGCLALQPGGKPQLILVDDDDAELGENPPTLTLDGTAYKVGDAFPVEGTAVTLSDVEGVPDQCAQGAAEQAWLVDD